MDGISCDFRDTYDPEGHPSSARELPDEDRASEPTPVESSSAQARVPQGFRGAACLGHAAEEQHHVVHLHTHHISVLLSSHFFLLGIAKPELRRAPFTSSLISSYLVIVSAR